MLCDQVEKIKLWLGYDGPSYKREEQVRGLSLYLLLTNICRSLLCA